jgi:uncharacterized membrane protein YuzA (DUF378 family)
MMKKCGCGTAWVAQILLVIGGLNWGLIGLGYFFGGNWNVVNLIFGNWMWLEALVYVLVGLSALGALIGCKCALCKACGVDTASSMMKNDQM